MRFMMIVKHAENQGPPPKALIDAITRAADEAVKNGACSATEVSGQPHKGLEFAFPAEE